MSDYTSQLRFICEAYAGRTVSGSSSDVDDIIELARQKIFDFDYPIFDDAYRKELETKILNHYYTQEIGLETVGLWKLKLRTKMREIMPYYNQLYLSERLQFDPFINTDYTDTRQTVGTDNNVTTTQNASDDMRVDIANDSHNVDRSGEEDGVNARTGNNSNVSRETSDSFGLDETTDTAETGKQGMTEVNPMSDRSTLTKSSDTPLGSVDGVTAVGNNSNYLTNVTETIENYNGANKKDVTEVTESSNTGSTHSGTTQTENVLDKNFDEVHNEDETFTHFHGDNEKGTADHTATSQGSSTGSGSTESVGSNASDYAGRLFGKTGSETYSEMLMKFRQTFLNIDMDVINELSDLFMLIW